MSMRVVLTFGSLFIICLAVVAAEAQPTAFTYQGKLTDNGGPANGIYDLKFALFDTGTGGIEVRPPQTVTNVSVAGGVFTVTLNFGPTAFVGPPRFLEISARPSSSGDFTLLTPRQQVTPAPYAIFSLNSGAADVAENAQKLGGVTANQYVLGDDVRLSDARTPAAGSSNYIQNSSNPQSAANFNISGNGTAGGTLSGDIVNAGTQFNLKGNRTLSVTGAGPGAMSNTFTGVGTGTATVPSPTIHFGNYNSFFGRDAGAVNSTGFMNSMFGSYAGVSNTTGAGNSFFGTYAGNQNTEAYFNSFFGLQAGQRNTSGSNGSFFGYLAGNSNTTGVLNSFFGFNAGGNNVSGRDNSFFGQSAGGGNLQGSFNSFFGTGAGASNRTEDHNTFLGAFADGATGITNATAIGARAQATQSNSLVLGSIKDVNGATMDTKVGIGTTSPTFKLHVIDPANTGLRVQNNTSGGTIATFGGFGDFSVDANGNVGGRLIIKENGNTGIGTPSPAARLDVNGNVRVGLLGGGGVTQLCLNAQSIISQCSSSLRYKTHLRRFTSGLNLINRLQPLTFTWKADQSRDLGLAAEDVAAVDPLLVTRNRNGEVEGVKYDRLAVVLINAVKEQQSQIKEQQSQIERQRAEIDELKKLVRKSGRYVRVRK